MPELVTSREQQLDDMTPKANIGRGMAIAPDATFDVPTPGPAPEAETFLHPVKAFNDLLDAVRANTAMVELLLKQSLKERVFTDNWIPVSQNVGYSVNFHERKYVYAYSFTAQTLTLTPGGTVSLAANTWTNLSPTRQTTVAIAGVGDGSPVVILFRACDVPMQPAVQQVAGSTTVSGTVNATLSTTNYSSNNIPAANILEFGMGIFNPNTGQVDRVTSITPTVSDGLTVGTAKAALLSWGGSANAWLSERVPTIFKEIKNTAVTAGTPVSVWTPAAGKNFHVLGYWLSLSVAGEILLEDTTGVEFWRTPALLAGAPFVSPVLKRGYISTAANNALFVDVSASGNVNGVIYGVEE